jgi:hypothetical protein
MRRSTIFWNIIYVILNLILFLTIKDYIYFYFISLSVFALAFGLDILSTTGNFKKLQWIFLTPIRLIGLAFAGIYYTIHLVEDIIIIPFNNWINKTHSEVEDTEPDYH